MSDRMIIGIDECGIGSIAGSVVAAAVILDGVVIHGLRDSKKLSHNRRVELSKEIYTKAKYWIIAESSVKLINRKGIARCHRDCIIAVAELARGCFPESRIIIDGNSPIAQLGEHETIVKADDKIPEVSAASIIAKVYRDENMVKLSSKYPKYGWEKNKGYPTHDHLIALREHGVTEMHRRDYGPVREVLLKNN